MEKEEFKKILIEKDYPYEESEGKLIVGVGQYNIDLSGLKSIPPCVIFGNIGTVDLNTIESIPSGVMFMNILFVHLNSLRRIDSSVKFLGSCMAVSPLLKPKVSEFERTFNAFSLFDFTITGIGDRRLLNKMISIGLFDR